MEVVSQNRIFLENDTFWLNVKENLKKNSYDKLAEKKV